MTRLKEMLGIEPLFYQWIDDDRCTFKFNDRLFGIYAEIMVLTLKTRSLEVANISFGVIKNNHFRVDDIDTTLTNFGKPMTVLSTVAGACLSNKQIIACDIISLAAADQVKDRRLVIYGVALAEIRMKHPEYRKKDIVIKTLNGSRMILLSKVDLTDEEKENLSQQLKLDKI